MQRQTLIRCILFLYLVMLAYFMFAGFQRTVHSNYRYNLIPLHTISTYMRNLDPNHIVDTAINLVGNIAIFVPLGFLIPAAMPRSWSYGKFVIFFICFISLLECLQTLLRVGTGDIDDLLLNVIGGSIGYAVFRQRVNAGV